MQETMLIVIRQVLLLIDLLIEYQRPCLLMRRKGDICKGSGRGSDKCEILDFNQWCKDTGLFNKVEGSSRGIWM